MADLRDLLEMKRRQAVPPPDALEGLATLRRRRHRNRRVAAGLTAILIAAAGIGGTFAALDLSGRQARQSTARPFGGVVPPPPSGLGLKQERYTNESGHAWVLVSHPSFMAEADRDAHNLVAFYDRAMRERGWTSSYRMALGSWVRFGYPSEDLFAGQVWRHPPGLVARIYVQTARAATPLVVLRVSLVPVSVSHRRAPLYVNPHARLIRTSRPPSIDPEFALQRAWLDDAGTSAAGINVFFGLLKAQDVAYQPVWVVVYEGVCPSPPQACLKREILVAVGSSGRLLLQARTLIDIEPFPAG